MRIIRSPTKMQKFSDRARRRGRSIGFVPTMGYLHEGHLSLIRKARKETDLVVISIFVNPAQFGPREDYRRYPRDLERDMRLSRGAGVDVIFYPLVRQMYPEGFVTYVDVEDLTCVLCGRSRPGHFRGVTTVVTKLFNIVKPEVAYFGQKDAQQAIVIKRMTKDLNMGIKIKVGPIVREPDGLAMSSRNKYLSTSQRRQALALKQALQKAKVMVKSGEFDANKVKSAICEIIKKKKSAKIDYVSIVDPETLRGLKRIKKKTLIALAVWVGKTRLIDNAVVRR